MQNGTGFVELFPQSIVTMAFSTPCFIILVDTHVAHHMFSTMPHYHAMEATKAMKSILGRYYQFDSTMSLLTLYKDFKECMFVEADGDGGDGVLWFSAKLIEAS